MAKRVGNKQLVFRTQRGLSWCCSLVFFPGKTTTTTTKQHQQKQQLKKQQKKIILRKPRRVFRLPTSNSNVQRPPSYFRLPTSDFRLPTSKNKTKKHTFVPIVTRMYVLMVYVLWYIICIRVFELK